jgi:hypothetical protein
MARDPILKILSPPCQTNKFRCFYLPQQQNASAAGIGALHGAYHSVMTMPHRFAGCGASAR